MFGWIFGKGKKKLEEKTERGFSAVKKDMDVIGKWIKHLDAQDKQLFEELKEIHKDLSSIKAEVEDLREAVGSVNNTQKDKQLFEKTGVYDKQTAVEGVEEGVQTAVQTGSFYDIFRSLSASERLLLFTLMNSDLKLSYEDLALLLGKERATVRGQINAIKQKSEGLIEEITEKTGKKRVFVPEEIKEKLAKYAKVRVSKKKKSSENAKDEQKSEI